MLVLTRKENEQILIGDDIKITVVKVRGKGVRVGIEAPREVRVVRAELAKELAAATDWDEERCEDESVFAYPQPRALRHGASKVPSPGELSVNAAPTSGSVSSGVSEMANDKSPASVEIKEAPQVFMTRVRCELQDRKPLRAPLARFLSAT
jgi:carbon storage regulator CsrA